MREVQPYKTEGGLLKALDNGGRFFNVFTRAGDDRITRAELAKAAGVFGSKPKAVLFFEMAQQALSRQARTRAVTALGPKERERFERDKASLQRQVEDRVRQITRGRSEDTLRDRDGERRRQRRDAFGDKPKRRPGRRR